MNDLLGHDELCGQREQPTNNQRTSPVNERTAVANALGPE
jgi:hypothetical protein